jgi:hypothetical protein
LRSLPADPNLADIKDRRGAAGDPNEDYPADSYPDESAGYESAGHAAIFGRARHRSGNPMIFGRGNPTDPDLASI